MLAYNPLPAIVDSLHIDDVSRVCALRAPVSSMRREFRREVPCVDYGDPDTGQAYMVAYFPHYVAPLHQVLESLPSSVTGPVFDKSKIEACMIGCGPAPELLGLSSFVSEHFKGAEHINVSLHDVNIDGWRPYLDLTLSRLIKPCWSGGLGVNRVSCSLLRDCGTCSSDTCRVRRGTVDIYVVQNCLNDAGSNPGAVSRKLVDLLRAAKPGALFVVINAGSSVARRIIKTVEARATASGLGDVVKPGCASVRSVTSGFESPRIIRDHLYTGANGLIAKRTVTYMSSVIVRTEAPDDNPRLDPGDEEALGAVHAAMMSGQTAALRRMLAKDSRLCALRDGSMFTPLHHAASFGDSEIVKLLCRFGADPDARDIDGHTPLHYAAALGCLESGRTLIDEGADIDAPDKDCATPLMCAAFSGGARMIRLLLSAGASIGREDRNGRTAIHAASETGRPQVALELLDHGANPDGRDWMGRTPVHLAASNGHSAMAAALLDKGATVDARDHDGCTALHVAASQGYPELVDLLLDRGFDREVEDWSGRRPVDLARANARHAATNRLANRADVHIRVPEALIWETAHCGG